MPVEVFLRPIVRFVLHLLATVYPVAKIQIRERHGRAQLDLLKDTKSAQAPAAVRRVEKGIDSG